LQYRLHAETSWLKYRWYAQNTEMIILRSKVEMFIHVAIQNFTMWLSYTDITTGP